MRHATLMLQARIRYVDARESTLCCENQHLSSRRVGDNSRGTELPQTTDFAERLRPVILRNSHKSRKRCTNKAPTTQPHSRYREQVHLLLGTAYRKVHVDLQAANNTDLNLLAMMHSNSVKNQLIVTNHAITIQR